MRLTLLRAPKFPDANADIGHHTFSYAVMPHHGTLQEAGVIEQATAFNTPLHVVPLNRQEAVVGGDPAVGTALVQVTCDGSNRHCGVAVDTVKLAEDDATTGGGVEAAKVVVRLYECYGGSHDVSLRVSPLLNLNRAQPVNLLEEPVGKATETTSATPIHFTPFQLATVALLH
eukprot:TRINITY_DN1448_c0_g1_i4.p1 TRINITY_DN1448_c0_g1~~TRINITY_DN1448_c0_g1_i4.p1  ORF type:complete len:173 (+),score=37.23 TRINITY_DN1448_c0_g1_i4:143-661(+)